MLNSQIATIPQSGPPEPPKLAYTIDQWCRATGLGRTKTYEEIDAGRLRAVRIAGRRLILKDDGEAYLKAYAEEGPVRVSPKSRRAA